MENFIVSLNVILPLFLTMLLGYILKHLKLFNESSEKSLNTLCFRVFLPILLFNNIYKTELKEEFNPKLLGFAVSSVTVLFMSLLLIIPLIEKDNRRRGVMIQGIFRSNFIIFGLPVVVSLFGENYAGVPSLLGAVVVPLFNALSVVALEIYRGGKVSIKKIAKGVATNPLIISSLMGLLMVLLSIKLPFALEKTIGDLSRLATPLSLMVLGASFKFSTVQGHLKQLIITLLGKLIISPLIFVPLGILLGFREIELVSLIVLFSSPTAVSSYTMAQQMDEIGRASCRDRVCQYV